MLANLFERLDLIGGTRSRLTKEAFLHEIKDSIDCEWFKNLCFYVFHPYYTYGLTAPKVPTTIPTLPLENDGMLIMEWVALMENLRKRLITGHTARDAVLAFYNIAGKQFAPWFRKLINKNLGVGLGFSTISKVFPDLEKALPSFSCALCNEYEGQAFDQLHLVERKLDGMRGVIGKFVEDEPIKALTRSGKPIYNTDAIVDLFTAFYPNYVFDGEFYAGDWSKTVSICRTQSDHPDKALLEFRVFDVVPLDEWLSKNCTTRQLSRKLKLQSMVDKIKKSFIHDNCPIIYVDHFLSMDSKEIKEVTNIYLSEGWEGSVIKDPEALYMFDRGDSWLKAKPTQTDDCKIVSITPGYRNSLTNEIKSSDDMTSESMREYTSLTKDPTTGGLLWELLARTVEIEAPNGVISGVGTGYSLQVRVDIWNNRIDLIDTYMEVKFQEYTPDGALRFPRFVRLRHDK